MEARDLSAGGSNPEASAVGVTPERLQPQAEAVEQNPGQIVIKESFCASWAEDPAGFDPAQAGWEQAARNVSAKIKEMLAAPEVTLTSDGLTPAQAAAKEQADLLTQANARAVKLAEDLVAVRSDVKKATAAAPPSPVSVEVPLSPAGTEIDQLVEAPVPEPTAPMPESTPLLDQLLEQVPAEMREETTQRLSEFGEDFNEEEFSKEHPEEYGFINQVILESSDPAKAAEAAGKIKARLDSLDKEEDGDKKKKDFLANLFGIYKHRLNQEKDPEKREELKKSMLGLNEELAGLGVGSLGGILEVIIGAIVGEVQEQLK